jgi:hypothetical protein
VFGRTIRILDIPDASQPMKAKLSLLILPLVAASLVATSLLAGTPEQEKAFVEKYKAAYESGDQATLETFLYTQGANPMALQFYKMIQADGVGGKIIVIALVPLTPEDVSKGDKVQEGPGGQKIKLPLKPVKKLKFTVEKKSGEGTSTSSSEFLIAEKDGKFVIPVPANAK